MSVRVTLQLTVIQSVSLYILPSSPFWNSRPDVNVLSDHYGFSHHEAPSLIRRWVCL